MGISETPNQIRVIEESAIIDAASEVSPAVVITVARGAIGRRILEESTPDPSTGDD